MPDKQTVSIKRKDVMAGQNPYTLAFGKEPSQMIIRIASSEEVLSEFTAPTPSQQVFMITGVRGSGKTVFMTSIDETLRKENSWVVEELNPERDLLRQLVAKLAGDDLLAKMFQNARINLSFWNVGLEVTGAVPVTDIETALSRMVESMQKHHKRLLISIDEVTNTAYVREFAAAFQILLRRGYPVFLLMTGLYEKINDLQNVDTLTFLYRAPKLVMSPLNLTSMADNYQHNLGIRYEKALEMAKITRGYSYAFQAFGYLTWRHQGDYEKALPELRQTLDEYIYEKIWSEMSQKDRMVAYAIANTPDGRIADIREKIHMDTNEFNPYRKRLIRKGILDGTQRGHVRFLLPLFEDFVKDNF